jgi:hypothetical protein
MKAEPKLYVCESRSCALRHDRLILTPCMQAEVGMRSNKA